MESPRPKRARMQINLSEFSEEEEEEERSRSPETYTIKIEPQQQDGQGSAEEEEGPIQIQFDSLQALQTIPVSAGKSKGRKVVDFDSDQEEDLVEWFQSHPEMYDHNQKAYKRTDYKNQLLQEKAEDMGVLSQDIMTWYRTQRTAFSRLMSNKTAKTFRSKWVSKNFQFLAPHIRLKGNNASLYELPDVSRDSSDTEPAEVPAPSPGPASTEKLSEESMSRLNDVLQTLAERLGNRESDTRAEEVLKESSENRRTWAMWLGGEVQDFNEEEWLDFNQEVSNLLYKYKRQVLQRRRTQPPKPRVKSTARPASSLPSLVNGNSSNNFSPLKAD